MTEARYEREFSSPMPSSRAEEGRPFLDVEPEEPIRKGPDAWKEALRPHHAGSPPAVRLWQTLCPYIPVSLFLLWCSGLISCLVLRPLWAVLLCDINMCWSLFEHSRWVAFGTVAMCKVLTGTRNQSWTRLATSGVEDEEPKYSAQHAVFVCAWKEDIEVMRQTLLSLANQEGSGMNGNSFARSFIGVCLCMEAREGPPAEEKAAMLIKEFENQFTWMKTTYHPENIPGDMQGKCSNLRWGVSQIRKQVTASLVTCADADSQFHLQYFSHVSTVYQELGARACCATVFQPTIVHFRNFYEQGGVVRGSSILSSIAFISYLEDLVYLALPYSTFTVPSTLVDKFYNWDADYVNDDWHTGTKSFIADPVNAQLMHIPLPVVNYAVEADTAYGALIARWNQAKRHALGVEELVYTMQMLPVAHTKLRIDSSTTFCTIVRLYLHAWRLMSFMSCVHIRLAFVLPEQITMLLLGLGVLHGSFVPGASEGWPLYGASPREFLTSKPYLLNLVFTGILLCFCIACTFISVRMVRNLTTLQRIKSEVPWWAKTSFQYLWELGSMCWSAPVVYGYAAAAEIVALFRVSSFEKKAFEFYVAPKPLLSVNAAQGA